ncbi:hypothetical protein [Paraburkholderia tropica]|uniref:hypothetical protein n=1 Tax=Paraburkholderia tropica TaxID=92647 RepID=UPI001F15D8B0|nr:hypothetical protein [Paraburkholderia tropica]
MTINIDIEALSKTERSILLYAETVCVDYGGLLDAQRMNSDDLDALRKFQEAGILTFGRIPSWVLGEVRSDSRRPSYWITFTDAAWNLAHALRRKRAEKPSVSRAKVDAALAEKAVA